MVNIAAGEEYSSIQLYELRPVQIIILGKEIKLPENWTPKEFQK